MDAAIVHCLDCVGDLHQLARGGLGIGKGGGRNELHGVFPGTHPAESLCEMRAVRYHPKLCEMDRPMPRAPSERFVVVLDIPEVNGCDNDQKGRQHSHLIPLSPPVEALPETRGLELCLIEWAKVAVCQIDRADREGDTQH